MISVDASDSFDTILELESMRLYKKCDTEVIASIIAMYGCKIQ